MRLYSNAAILLSVSGSTFAQTAVHIFTITKYPKSCSIPTTLPAIGWIYTNGTSIPYTFAANGSTSENGLTGGFTHGPGPNQNGDISPTGLSGDGGSNSGLDIPGAPISTSGSLHAPPQAGAGGNVHSSPVPTTASSVLVGATPSGGQATDTGASLTFDNGQSPLSGASSGQNTLMPGQGPAVVGSNSAQSTLAADSGPSISVQGSNTSSHNNGQASPGGPGSNGVTAALPAFTMSPSLECPLQQAAYAYSDPPSGDLYQVQCNTVFAGSVGQTLPGQSVESCISACSEQDVCIAAGYDADTAQCYLYSSVTPGTASFSPKVQFAQLRVRAVVTDGRTSSTTIAPFDYPLTSINPGSSPLQTTSIAQLIFPGTTLLPGSSAVISGVTYSLPALGGANGVYIDGNLEPLPTAPPGSRITFPNGVVAIPTSTLNLVIGSQTLTPSTVPALILPGATLFPGSSALVSGTTYSLPISRRGDIYINAVSFALPTAAPGSPITLPNGLVATSTVEPYVAIGSETLVPGGPAITAAGTTYSLSGSQIVVIASSTTFTGTLSPPSNVPATPTLASNLVIGLQTLVPGSVITISGTTYSLSGSEVVIAAPSTTYTSILSQSANNGAQSMSTPASPGQGGAGLTPPVLQPTSAIGPSQHYTSPLFANTKTMSAGSPSVSTFAASRSSLRSVIASSNGSPTAANSQNAPPAQVLQNGNFDTGSLAPWTFNASLARVDFSVTNNTAVVRYARISSLYDSLASLSQPVNGRAGQQYVFSADLWIDIPTGASDIVSVSVVLDSSIYDIGPITSSQFIHININGTLAAGAPIIQLMSNARGDRVAAVSWDNVYLLLSDPVSSGSASIQSGPAVSTALSGMQISQSGAILSSGSQFGQTLLMTPMSSSSARTLGPASSFQSGSGSELPSPATLFNGQTTASSSAAGSTNMIQSPAPVSPQASPSLGAFQGSQTTSASSQPLLIPLSQGQSSSIPASIGPSSSAHSARSSSSVSGPNSGLSSLTGLLQQSSLQSTSRQGSGLPTPSVPSQQQPIVASQQSGADVARSQSSSASLAKSFTESQSSGTRFTGVSSSLSFLTSTTSSTGTGSHSLSTSSMSRIRVSALGVGSSTSSVISSSSAASQSASQSSSLCLGGSNTYTAQDGSLFLVSCDVDYYVDNSNLDYSTSTQQANTLQKCTELCDSNTQCMGATWDSDSQQCNMGSTMQATGARMGVHGVLRRTAPSSAQSLTQTVGNDELDGNDLSPWYNSEFGTDPVDPTTNTNPQFSGANGAAQVYFPLSQESDTEFGPPSFYVRMIQIFNIPMGYFYSITVDASITNSGDTSCYLDFSSDAQGFGSASAFNGESFSGSVNGSGIMMYQDATYVSFSASCNGHDDASVSVDNVRLYIWPSNDGTTVSSSSATAESASQTNIAASGAGSGTPVSISSVFTTVPMQTMGLPGLSISTSITTSANSVASTRMASTENLFSIQLTGAGTSSVAQATGASLVSPSLLPSTSSIAVVQGSPTLQAPSTVILPGSSLGGLATSLSTTSLLGNSGAASSSTGQLVSDATLLSSLAGSASNSGSLTSLPRVSVSPGVSFQSTFLSSNAIPSMLSASSLVVIDPGAATPTTSAANDGISPSAALSPSILATSSVPSNLQVPSISSSTLLLTSAPLTVSATPLPAISSSTTSAVALPSALCPQGDGSTYTGRDGSLYLIVCIQAYETLGIPGILPFSTATFAACIDFCMNQGPQCQGVTYKPAQTGGMCHMKNSMSPTANAAVLIYSAVRITGPLINGVRNDVNAIVNGVFNGTLSPWVPTVTGLVGAVTNLVNQLLFTLVNGVAQVGIPLSLGILGTPVLYLTETLTSTIAANTAWYLQADLGLVNAQISTTTSCWIYFRTDQEILWSYYYDRCSQQGTVNGSGIITKTAATFYTQTQCSGSTDITISFANIIWRLYPLTAGLSPIVLTPVQVLTNNDFLAGTLAPWVVTSATNAVTTVSITTAKALQVAFALTNSVQSTVPCLINQTLNTIRAGETWWLQASVAISIPRAGDNLLGLGYYGTCNVMLGDNFWQQTINTKTGSWLVNITGIAQRDFSNFTMLVNCYGNAAATVTLDDIYLTRDVNL